MLPAGNALLAMAKALEVKPDFFFRSHDVHLENVEFRKKSRLPRSEECSIRESAYDYVRRYVALERILNIEKSFVNPFSEANVAAYDTVESLANRFREEWGIGRDLFGNVLGVLENYGVKVLEFDAEEAFDGMAARFDGVPVIIVNRSHRADRKRFTALHELGHLVLKFPEGQSQKECERCCHRFAGSLLLPDYLTHSLFGDHRASIFMHELGIVKERYGISVQATMQRLRDLGIVSEQLYISFRKRISKDREEKKFAPYTGAETAERFRQLLLGSVSSDTISLSKAAELDNKGLAEFKREYTTI
jgi:Zn-dependent peptidase ImmA (M78 family)